MVEYIEGATMEEMDFSLYNALKDLCKNNSDFFRTDDSEYGQRLHEAFIGIIDHLETVMPLVSDISQVAANYDFDAATPGNGYKSFVAVVNTCVAHTLKLAQWISYNRDSYIFRKGHYMREVESCSHVLASLGTCLQHLKTLISWSEDGSLFPKDSHSPKELLTRAENINQYCFYGRCLGFQFCSSMRKVLKFISIAMASYSEIYYGEGGFLSKASSSLWTGGKYYIDPELRARRIVNISQHAPVDFCKSFWLLAETEVMTRLPSIVSPTVAVNHVIEIPPEPLELDKVDGSGRVQIPIPSSHIGSAPVCCRLISAVRRQGMIAEGVKKDSQSNMPGPSKGLIIHCHGGGFVAQSSRSHESYLRDWAVRLDIPILSIDYSLSPEAPFPRALEEVLYAYCWGLSNASVLGSTGERVVLVGDSAGANLNLGVAMKCQELGIRSPDGLFLAYIPVLVAFVPSPSRFLCLMDPLLPFGFMMQCLKAYAGQNDEPSDHSEDTVKKSSISNSMEGKSPELEINRESPSSASDLESFEEVSASDLTDSQPQAEARSFQGQLLDKLGSSDTLTTVSLASPQPPMDKPNPNGCAAQFFEQYVLDSDVNLEGEEVPVLREAGSKILKPGSLDVVGEVNFPKKLSSAASRMVGSLTGNFMGRGSQSSTKAMTRGNSEESKSGKKSIVLSALDNYIQRSPSEEFQFEVPKDPYLSPYWASDDVLRKLPPVSILSLQFDPCLDDCVMFAKKLKGIGNDVQLDILEGLPHGFLNFSLVSKEAHEGSLICIKRISRLLGAEVESP
ncbi:hormone-sensitive lipase isoform X2 [Ischnura elegans]|uniref:hormone-sensitive lipase isoform X2 n=1 Tax=Ischnura elegans TaxID=197161 RepID=UPI001ED868DF|nr:hormone-sensitive lipase isoform X2 [Ischnura elegans]